MPCLIMDTALSACSVGFFSDQEKSLTQDTQHLEKGHAEALLPMVAQVMAITREHHDIQAPDRIGVTIGPGSFTGLRVALSAARALALVYQCPVIGVSTLEVLAMQAAHINPNSAIIATAIDARNDNVYGQIFHADGTQVTDPEASTLENFAQQINEQSLNFGKGGIQIIGSGAKKLTDILKTEREVRTEQSTQAISLAALAGIVRHRQPSGSPSPLYLRPVNAVASSRFAVARL